MKASRAVCFVLSLGGAVLAGAASASTPALVVEADTGKVLYAERATAPWYPASITKLMTVYVALDAVRQGRVSLDTLLGVTSTAVAMPPSKMGFKPGTEVTLDNALKMIMVKSANDVSVTIAEGIGGSVEGFADMMNAAAQRLGMRESRFVNPHGLPDERQQTSARDMAILARALLREFPEYQSYFQISAIKLGRRVMSNHNGLIGRYPGADGMKTGFICASGFNLVASATREGRRLITVVMGSSTATERTIKAAQLLDQGFASSGWRAPSLQELPSAAWLPPPDLRTVICDRRKGMPAEDDAEAAAEGEEEVEDGSTPVQASVLNFLEPAATATSVTAGLTKKGRPKLVPRVHSAPVLVWTGATPSTMVAEEDEPPRRTRNAKLKRKSQSRTAKGSAPRAAKAVAAADSDEAPRKASVRSTAAKTAKSRVTTTAAKPNKTAAVSGAAKKTAAASAPAKKKPATAERALPPKRPVTGAKAEPKPGHKKPQAARQKQAEARVRPE